MKLSQIITSRNLKNIVYTDIVYEWEDILKDVLNLRLVNEQPFRNNRFLQKYRLSKFITTNKDSIVFNMDPFSNVGYNKPNIVPWIIDYYATAETAQWLFKSYTNNRIVLISSKEANDYISGLGLSINNIHLALSISDKYKISSDTKFTKLFDLVLLGRKSPKMEEYINKYSSTHPNITIVSRDYEDGRLIARTNKGDFVADITERDNYINLMRASKCAIYTTAGMDGRTSWTNGFNQVTPRFLEMIASGCHVLCYYKQNSDTDFYEFNKYWPSVDNYDTFEKQLDYALKNDVDMTFYADYLSNHYTSVRAKQLIDILTKL